MASELNMYESQIQEYKYEIERISRELHDLKKKYYSQKRKEQLQKYFKCFILHFLFNIRFRNFDPKERHSHVQIYSLKFHIYTTRFIVKYRMLDGCCDYLAGNKSGQWPQHPRGSPKSSHKTCPITSSDSSVADSTCRAQCLPLARPLLPPLRALIDPL